MRREEQLATLKSVFDESQIEALMTAFGAPKITKDKVDEAFDDFWKWFPKRQTTHSKKGAYERFRKIVSTGVEPEALAHTAKSYLKEMERANRIGTEYVKMATTFLGKEKPIWQEHMPKGEEHKWELVPKFDTDHAFSEAAKRLWRGVCFQICCEVGDSTYRAWFDKLELFEVSDTAVVLKATSKFSADYVSNHFGSRLCELFRCPVRVVHDQT